MPGILYLEVNAGLCNRLRALVSGICWAERLGRKLVICWPSRKPECAAGFYELFAHSSLPDGVEVIDGTLSQKNTCLSPADAEKYIVNHPENEPISIQSYGCFWALDRQIWLQHLRALKPSNAVRLRLDDYRRKGCENLDTAIHIRRTDNEKAIRLSPLGTFIEKIREMPAPQRFILFSDDHQAIRLLVEEFGLAKFICPEMIRERASREGMIEAVAVFFTLASCQMILGSVNSSFSEIARDYGANTLVLVRA
jgi:hypothetical protein